MSPCTLGTDCQTVDEHKVCVKKPKSEPEASASDLIEELIQSFNADANENSAYIYQISDEIQ